jgi:hypothetical protein
MNDNLLNFQGSYFDYIRGEMLFSKHMFSITYKICVLNVFDVS